MDGGRWAVGSGRSSVFDFLRYFTLLPGVQKKYRAWICSSLNLAIRIVCEKSVLSARFPRAVAIMYTKRPWLKIVEIFVVSLLVLTGLRMIVLKQSGSTKSSDTGNTQETVTAAESGIGADTILPKVSKIEIGDQSGGTQRHEISKEAAPVDLSERMSEDSTPVCNISARYSRSGEIAVLWLT